MKNNKLLTLFLGFFIVLIIVSMGCKREGITGVTTKETGKVYFPGADSTYGGAVNSTNNFINDTANKVVVFSTPLYRGGESDLSAFSVGISVDNSSIASMIASGQLPGNTVVLDPSDYTLESSDTLTFSSGVMQCSVTPRIKASSLQKNYSGKYAALGLVVSNTSKFEINPTMNKVVLYFNADSVFEAITPRTNLIADFSNWTPVNISNNNNVTATLNASAASILFQGGNGGYDQTGVYQTIKLNNKWVYKANMFVKGSGATNVWFEVWITQKQPQNGTDVGTGFDPTAVQLLGLNTWSGCGGSAFNGLLATVGCTGNGGTFTAPQTGTYYITIKAGGNDLGTTGITASQFSFQ